MNKTLTVLLADDNEIIRTFGENAISSLVTPALKEKGIVLQLDIAQNGAEARDMINKRQYDVCILDNQMGKPTGVELAKEIEGKQHPRLVLWSGEIKETGRIAMTQDPSITAAAHLFAYFLSKPCNMKYFVEFRKEIFGQ